MQFPDAIWWCHNKSNMADGRHLENRLSPIAIHQRHVVLLTKIWMEEAWSHAVTSDVIKIANFENWRSWTTAIWTFFCIPQSQIICFWWHLLYKFEFWFYRRSCDKNKIYLFLYNFDISDERHLEKFFGYITASYCLINEKFGSKK